MPTYKVKMKYEVEREITVTAPNDDEAVDEATIQAEWETDGYIGFISVEDVVEIEDDEDTLDDEDE